MEKKRGREKPKSAVYQHFSLTDDGKYYVCEVVDENSMKSCGAKISAFCGLGKSSPSRASNLKRHLQRHHPAVLMLIIAKDAAAGRPTGSYIPCTSGQVRVKKEPKRPKRSKEGKDSMKPQLVRQFKTSSARRVTVSMTADKFKSCIIEMVVKSAVPPSLFSSPAFLGLNGDIAQHFGVSLERDSIKTLVIEEAKRQKDAVKELLYRKFVHLKLDTCTRQKFHYFTINVQFLDERKDFVMRTLALRCTEAHHSAEYLQKLVVNVLEEFGISKGQVLSIVSDHASNLRKNTVEKAEGGEEVTENYDDMEIPENCENDDAVDVLIDSAARLMQIDHTRCAVHTLQLAMRDGLQERQVAKLIERLRKIVSAAKAPHLDAMLKLHAGKGVLVDHVRSWGSTYLMIKRLLELKPYLMDTGNPEINMTEAEWEEVRVLEALLRHPYGVTQKLQSADLTPGVFYKEWRNLIFCLSLIGGTIADGIKNSMIRRETQLLDNDILLAAIYADPMYRVTLTGEQKIRAKNALCSFAIRMEFLPWDYEPVEQLPYIGSTSFSSQPMDIGDDDQFSKRYLDEQELAKRRRSNLEECGEKSQMGMYQFKVDFNNALREVEQVDCTLKLNAKEAIPRYPLMVQNSAHAVTALPLTQVSLERMCSALQVLKSDFRSEMEEDLIEAILFLRTNSI
ncbi:unnamed protein product [Lymnaea stagnalis]|uniref:Uncharacterized protein n=1 Tax=Lymnaea stagnalis TaxID=6523 RepID=A0AAV2HMY7_LYMST